MVNKNIVDIQDAKFVVTNTGFFGIDTTNPSVKFQVGTTLYVDNTNKRIGIGIAEPEEDLEVDGSIQIDSANVARLKFQQTGQNPHALCEIDGELDGTNGGQIEFYTKVNSGSVTEKLRINNVGAIGIGGAVYGSSGQVLKSNGSGSAVSWTDQIGTTYSAGTGISINGSNEITNTAPDQVVTFFNNTGITVSGVYPAFSLTNNYPPVFYGPGTGVSINASNEISIGQDVAPNASPTFNILTLGNGGNANINLTDLTNFGYDTIAQIKGITDGSNGGKLQFFTKADSGGVLTPRITINSSGALGLGFDVSYGNSGQLLQSRGSGNTPIWVNPPSAPLRLFQAYTTGTQTKPNGVPINIWDINKPRHIDTEKALNPLYGLVSNQYKISTAGYWRFACHVRFTNSPGNGASLSAFLRINNNTNNLIFNSCNLTDAAYNPDQQGVSVSAILNLAVGDVLDVFIQQFSGLPLANVDNAMFEGQYIGI